MLINLRNALMTGKRLPYDAEVEYLESMGTQWIDTGVVANGEFDAEYTISTPSSFRAFIVGGARSTTQHLNFGQYEPNGSFTMAYLGSWWTALTTIAANTTYTARIHYSSGSQTATVNGTAAASRSYSGTESLNLNIYLFKRNFYGASDTFRPMTGKMYSFKIWQNGVLVRDYIPVRKGNVGYLYDRVSGKLFGNAGSGDFVLGQDVVPVEYIESHGTEYIDTDKSVDLPIHLEADINFTNPNTGSNVQTLVGGYNAGQSNQRFWVTSLPQGKINCGLLTNSISADLVPSNRKVHLVVDFENGRQTATIDGVQYTSASQSTTNYWFRDWKLRIFQSFGTVVGHNNIPLQAITNRIDIDIGASQALRLSPVRIGSGSTWEGAMMDTLTRRIYRNQGTGAFGYGNDLKYPIPAA